MKLDLEINVFDYSNAPPEISRGWKFMVELKHAPHGPIGLGTSLENAITDLRSELILMACGDPTVRSRLKDRLPSLEVKS